MSNERRASVFITKFRMKTDKNGNDYLIGSIGLGTATLRPHKTKAGEWNLFISESAKKDDQQSGGYNKQSGGGYAGPDSSDFGSDFNDEIPF